MTLGILLALLMMGSDPVELLKQAREAVQREDFRAAVRLTHEANAIWGQGAAQLPEYANSLVLESLGLLAEKHKGKAWEEESAELLEHAVKIAEANPAVSPSVLALALELESIESTHKNDRDALLKRAESIHGEMVERILPEREGMLEAIPMGGTLVSPKLITPAASPELSVPARVAKVWGTVKLSVCIDPDGRTSSAKLVKPLGWGLDEAAAQALKQWRFKPGTKDGRNERVRAQVEVSFKAL